VAITGGGSGLTYKPNANACNSQSGGSADTFTYTLNGGSVGSVSVTVTCVNDAPSFTKGPDQSTPESSGAQTVNPWATSISPGAANESGQVLNFQITNTTNAALFSTQPAVSPTGVLTYTPQAGTSGDA